MKVAAAILSAVMIVGLAVVESTFAVFCGAALTQGIANAVEAAMEGKRRILACEGL